MCIGVYIGLKPSPVNITSMQNTIFYTVLGDLYYILMSIIEIN